MRRPDLTRSPDQTAAAGCGTPVEQVAPPGLRERKKARTRAAIREHALALFRQQGYHETTVEQIAEAAEVSPATFFRYFPTKEDVVLQDDFDLITLAALEAQPSHLSPVAAARAAITATLSAMTPADQALFTEGAQLVRAIPEIRARAVDELARAIDVLADALSRRTSLPADDVTCRSVAGAVVGVVIAAMPPWHGAVESGDPSLDLAATVRRVDAGLALLEAGFPAGGGRAGD